MDILPQLRILKEIQNWKYIKFRKEASFAGVSFLIEKSNILFSKNASFLPLLP